MTVEALEAIKNDEVILFSSTASADVFTGREDNFYRSILTGGQMAEKLCQYVIVNGIKKIALVYDIRNQTFADGWIKTFTREMENAGGTITSSISFDSDSENKYREIAAKVGEGNTEAVLFIANAFSTALLCRYITEIDPEIMKISSTWAFANFEDLEAYGEDSVEELISVQPFTLNVKQPEYLKFTEEYNNRFGKDPSPGSVYGYEAGLVLVEALKHAPSLDFTGIQSGLKNVKVEGLHGAIGLDQYGDVLRDVFLVQIKNGQLVQVFGE